MTRLVMVRSTDAPSADFDCLLLSGSSHSSWHECAILLVRNIFATER